MTLYEKVQKYLRSEGWKLVRQYTKDGKLMKNAPLVMNKTDNEKKLSLIAVITKRNIIHPAIYRLSKGDIQQVDLESIHIKDFLSSGINNVYKAAEIRRVK
jgi:hypothetical protein